MRSAIHPAEAVGLHCHFSTIDCIHTCVCVCSLAIHCIATSCSICACISGSRLGDHCTHQEFMIKFCCQVGKVDGGGKGLGQSQKDFFLPIFKKKVQS